MKRPLALVLTGLAVLGATAASAQSQSAEIRRGDWPGDQGRARVTFYEYPNFQGRSFTLDARDRDFTRSGFNDKAQSLRVDGDGAWRICEHADFGGRCQTVSGDVRDLGRFNLNRMVSSAEPLRDDRPGDDRPTGGSSTIRDGYEGRATVFFRQPKLNGLDVASARGGAEFFCRRLGLGAPAFYDDSETARRAIDRTGRVVFNQPVLRDVLCRKR
ncbi:beta/gamma crystallin-related protein [Caulobacter sp. 17J80-11]|uniref:beta/gamma crystallin-related protein n=1 Tax=Caulobacter sp. 17J80-11 TaxID=2763502 RepID=UPI00165372BC|nr:beta/gamma crystallin-related protein [Caulobacter sp. 17J80-11]MBC6981086.1 beta/gamma crystallin family protein [Caulobacter sp. 17J80-11]